MRICEYVKKASGEMASGQDSADLSSLSASLTVLLSGPLRQNDVASQCDVDQGLISRLQAGSVKRITERVRRVQAYVNMQIDAQALPDAVSSVVRAYLAGGGDPLILCEQIRLLVRARAMADTVTDSG